MALSYAEDNTSESSKRGVKANLSYLRTLYASQKKIPKNFFFGINRFSLFYLFKQVGQLQDLFSKEYWNVWTLSFKYLFCKWNKRNHFYGSSSISYNSSISSLKLDLIILLRNICIRFSLYLLAKFKSSSKNTVLKGILT